MKTWGSTLFGWRVRSGRSTFRVIPRWQLQPGDHPLSNPGVSRSQIHEWGRYSSRLLPELYQAAYGRPAPDMLTDRDTTIEEQLEEAFRNRRLLLLPGELLERKHAGGSASGGAAGAPPPPPPAGSQTDDESDSSSSSSSTSGSGEETAPPPKKTEKTWFRATLKDEDGEPMADEDYTLIDTDGVKRTGKLDPNGEVYIPAILPPGQCTISFPNIHLNPRKKKK